MIYYNYRPERSFNTTQYLNCDPTGRWAPCLPGEAPRGGAPLPAGAAQSDGAPGWGTAGGCPGGAALPATGRGMSAAGAALWPKTAAAGTTGRWMEKRLEKRIEKVYLSMCVYGVHENYANQNSGSSDLVVFSPCIYIHMANLKYPKSWYEQVWKN